MNEVKKIDYADDGQFCSGHVACAGCAEALAMRVILNSVGQNAVGVVSPSCSAVILGGHPLSSARIPFLHGTLESAAASASGIKRALRAQGKDDTTVLCFAGDGGTYDIGFQSLSGMLERHHNVLYVTYDNEAYMNTGIQRSSSTPHAASTTTSPAGAERMGKRHLKKDLLSIVAAHHIPYAASASVAYPADLQRKVRYAMGVEGPTFLVIHSPCPLGWRHDSALTIEIARRAVECGLFPLVELERGALTNIMPIREPRPVADYLELQGRFAHLFKKGDYRAAEELDHLQALADHNIATYGLRGDGNDPLDTTGVAQVKRGGPLAGRN